MHSPDTADVYDGHSFAPPPFALQNGTETPPDQENENENDCGLRPEIIEQLEAPDPGDDPMDLDETTGDGPEMETDETDEMEQEAQPSIQMKQAPAGTAPIQMAAKYNRKKKTKKLKEIVSKNGFRVNFKPRTSKQRTYVRKVLNINVSSLSELRNILQYIEVNENGSLVPKKVLGKFRGGFVINPTSGRFINGSKGIVDHAKYNTSGFSLGTLNSSSGAKGQHELTVPHSSLTNDVGHEVSYKNTKDQDVSIRPNKISGKLEKFWHQNGIQVKAKQMDQMESGEYLQYLAEKRKKLLAEKKRVGLGHPNFWALNTAVINMSEMIAELSTQMAMDQFMPGYPRQNSHTSGGKQGEFDQVFSNGTDYYAMECKGGGSSLGGRKNPNGPGKVQQGSKMYTEDLLNVYKNDSNNGIRTLGNNMDTAMQNDRLHYMHVKQTFDNNDDITPYLHMKQFDV